MNSDFTQLATKLNPDHPVEHNDYDPEVLNFWVPNIFRVRKADSYCQWPAPRPIQP